MSGDLKLLCPRERVLEVLNVLRLLEAIETFDDEAKAAASFRPLERFAVGAQAKLMNLGQIWFTL
jgi:hypothetical protein